MSRGFYTTYGNGVGPDRVVTQAQAGGRATMSFAAWAWMNGGGAGGSGTIIGNTGGLIRNALVQVYSTDTTQLRLFSRGHQTTTGVWTWPHAGTQRWQHVCVTYDSTSTTNAPVAYVNGQAASVTLAIAPVGAFTNTASRCTIGSDNDSNGGAVWDGMLAHAAVWSGVLLTPMEAFMLAQGTPPLHIQPGFLSMYTPLDGVSAFEPDLVFGCAFTTSGRPGRSDPPMMQPGIAALDARMYGPIATVVAAATAEQARAWIMA